MEEINGLPAHVLLVHAVVVLVPLTALALVLAALWPRARARLGALPLAMSAAVLVLVPLTTSAGEWLERRLPSSPLIEEHTRLGDTLLPWAVAMVLVAAGLWWLDGASGRRRTRGIGPVRLDDRWSRVAVGVLAVAVAAGAVVTVYRIGDSGARAVWEGVARDG